MQLDDKDMLLDTLMINPHGIELPEIKITEFCNLHHIQRLFLFGSILRDDFGPESDVDMLVEFERGHIPGLFRMAGLQKELSNLLGRKVDLRTPGDLSRYFRDEVLASAKVVYDTQR